MTEPFHIWEGIYASFAEAGGSTAAFAEPLWAERSKEKVLRDRGAATAPGSPSPVNTSHEYCIPLVAALLQAELGRVRILDFGGSVGLTVRAIVSAVPHPDRVEIHVVDNDSICRAGREIFRGDGRISFHTEAPAGVLFDIVHLGSSIQYVSAWTEQVQALVASSPKYLVFDDVPAGEGAAFVSLQNYYGKKIPHWFFNAREFITTIERATGYHLCYRARYIGTFLGKSGPHPMENFPEERRIDGACNLVFVNGRFRAPSAEHPSPAGP